MEYKLPELPYDYSALEPYISGFIMELHHDKHHNAYVSGANQSLEQISEARQKDDFSKINQLSKNYAFNFAGHVNHSVFWDNMAPTGQEPIGELAEAIKDQFGSIEIFKKQFSAVAAGVQGSGWAVLVWDSYAKKLNIVQLFDHQANLALSLTPILLLDVWEHAYYLDYKNVRGDYISAWWNIINWQDANQRFAAVASKKS
ncbi:MAG: superoxide dismutase [Bifidobacteriaceae bacterium]|jgi:Fe-Mn family superoxide dismutase|nr:superoxide dismutase [Bifidobacteriaceae bacterium]